MRLSPRTYNILWNVLRCSYVPSTAISRQHNAAAGLQVPDYQALHVCITTPSDFSSSTYKGTPRESVIAQSYISCLPMGRSGRMIETLLVRSIEQCMGDIGKRDIYLQERPKKSFLDPENHQCTQPPIRPLVQSAPCERVDSIVNRNHSRW